MTSRLSLRLGDLFVVRGLLTYDHVQVLLQYQQESHRPLGELAEAYFGLSPRDVEAAWAQQYVAHGHGVDLDREVFDPALADKVSRREAWQFELLPLYRGDGCLVLATTQDRLPRAAAFAWAHFGEPVLLLVAEPAVFRAHLIQRYPWPALESLSPRQRLRAAMATEAQEAAAQAKAEAEARRAQEQPSIQAVTVGGPQQVKPLASVQTTSAAAAHPVADAHQPSPRA
jgi:hypothetical protein